MNVEQEIQNYITANENSGALLITGKWGCGKTYLLKSIIKTINDGDKYLLSLVSLFGVDSIDSMHKTIKESVFFARGFENNSETIKNNFKKFKDRAKPLLDAWEESSKVIKGINTALNINWQDFFTIQDEIECMHEKQRIRKKLVLIFDDFERSKVDRIELMGAINDYCENKNIKVILVADEEHINNEEGEYKEFKEKLISRTVRIMPEYENIIRSIVTSYNETETGYCNFLKRNMELILQVFSESKTENLRSLKSFFLDFERVFAAWKNNNIPTDFLPKVFYNFGAILFVVKSGNYKSDEKYGGLFADDKIRDNYKNWDSSHKLSALKHWIVDGVWDEEGFVEEAKRKYDIKEISDDQKFLLCDFWALEQQNIVNGMPIVLESAYSGQLNRNELVELFQKIYAMKKYEVPFPCSVEYSQIVDGFEVRRKKILSSEIQEPKLRRSAFREYIPEECKLLYDDMTKFEEYLIAFENKKKVIEYLNPDSKISEYSLNGLIVGFFDGQLLEHFWVAFANADNYKKRELARVIINLGYKDRFYSSPQDMQESINNFDELKKRLKDYKAIISDCMTIAIVNETIKEIDEIIKEISENLELLKQDN